MGQVKKLEERLLNGKAYEIKKAAAQEGKKVADSWPADHSWGRWLEYSWTVLST